MKSKKLSVILSIIFIVLAALLISLFFYIKPFYDIKIKDVLNIKKQDTNLLLSINTDDKYITCGYIDKNNKHHLYKTINGKCSFSTNKEIKYLYIKKLVFVRKYNIDNYIINDNLPKKIFMTLNEEKTMDQYIDLNKNLDITYKSKNEKIAIVSKNKIIAKQKGITNITMTANNNYKKDFEVEVTNLITKRPKKFNKHKANLKCKKYTSKEATKLEEILENKTNNVGYKTRASVVEAVRFLLLDFPYQIEYFFENGRLNGGQNKADGEGRYYHKGLYLSEEKFKNLKYTFSGPAMWGCPLMNYEDWETTFKKGTYKPNGLDCSGFVSWALLNGGYDIGDRGAGDNLENNDEINDIGGQKEETSVELFKSGKIKAGDLLGTWGHIAIIAGIDDTHVYVAESLWTFGGPVINTYTFEEAEKEFVQVVLLDDLYKNDGLYTNMWY